MCVSTAYNNKRLREMLGGLTILYRVTMTRQIVRIGNPSLKPTAFMSVCFCQ